MDKTLFQIRLTGVLIEERALLLVKQRVSSTRNWSLPGGKLEHGETIEEGLTRELVEETGLSVTIEKLLYVCEDPDASPPLIHMTFLIKRTGGVAMAQENNLEINPITEVRMISVDELREFGFSQRFIKLIKDGFPKEGNYIGLKEKIGL